MEYTVFSPNKVFTISARDQKEAVIKAAKHFVAGSEFIVGDFHYHKYMKENGEIKIIHK